MPAPDSTRQHPHAPAQHPTSTLQHSRSTSNRLSLLERIGEAAVVQLYADGFERLSVRNRILCWHLYQAALAGRDIYYDQRYAYNLEMRAVLEAILRHPAGVEPQTLAAITRYTKLFWINTGPFNNLTARKFVPAFTPEALSSAVSGCRRQRRAAAASRRRIAGRPAGASPPPVLRPRVRVRRDQQDSRAGPRHPAGQRQQSVCRRVDGRSGRVRRALSAELAAGQTRRRPG